MNIEVSRRGFIGAGVGLATAFAGGSLLAATQPAPRIRRNVLTPGGSADLAKYRDGVTKMKALPANDSRNWTFQANIHGVPSDGGSNPAWAHCQHGTAYFLPWHRWYVYYFEEIIRSLINDDTFALPFWPYQADAGNVDNSSTRILPEAFRVPGDATNPLFVSARDPDVNAGKPFASTDAYSAGAMRSKNFLSPPPPGFGGYPVGPAHDSTQFGGIENNPHNSLHMAVGGYQALGWMTDPDVAARDPIFWLHHSNIDRLWEVWRSRGNLNPTTGVEGFDLDQSFDFFDRNGKAATGTVKACFSTSDLGYTYEAVVGEFRPEVVRMGASEEKPPKSVEGLVLATSPPPIALIGKRLDVRVSTAEEARPKLEALAAGHSVGRLVLLITGVKVDKQPRAGFEVYMNLPADATTPTAAKSPFFVGNLTFFGVKGPGQGGAHHHAGGGKGVDFAFDITGIVDDLAKRKFVKPDGFTISIIPYTSGRHAGEPVDLGAKVTFDRATVEAF